MSLLTSCVFSSLTATQLLVLALGYILPSRCLDTMGSGGSVGGAYELAGASNIHSDVYIKYR